MQCTEISSQNYSSVFDQFEAFVCFELHCIYLCHQELIVTVTSVHKERHQDCTILSVQLLQVTY